MDDMQRRSFFRSFAATAGAALLPSMALAEAAAQTTRLPGLLANASGKVRRVVTGHTPAGKAAVVSDVQVDAITLSLAPGSEHYDIWGSDQPLRFPDDGSPPVHHAHFPPVGGFRFGLVTIPPESRQVLTDTEIRTGMAELESKLPGLAAHLDPHRSGMHRSATIDFEYVISGEMWLELDDGQEVLLRAGDTVIQNGTRHAWHNKHDIPCQMVVCMIGAHWQAA